MKIALLGDIALFGCNTIENQNYIDKFSPIKDCLSKYDYVIANLETPLTNSKKTVGGKSAYIKGSPQDVEILKYLGVTHVSLANNHMFDYRQNGVEDTIETLDNAGVTWFGLKGKTLDLVDENTKLRLHGYCCYSTNGKELDTVVDLLNPKLIEEDIKKDRMEGFLPLLSCHWGQEHVHYPNYDHVRLARKLAECGRFILQGHHPHVLQGIEEYKGSLIAYSLGNFCFDDVYTSKSKEPLIKLSEGNCETIVLGVDLKDNELIKYNMDAFDFNSTQYKSSPEITEEISIWTDWLKVDEKKYAEKRKNELNAYLGGRKKERDFTWYVKRLNFESVKMILSSRSNQKKYDSVVRNYIK